MLFVPNLLHFCSTKVGKTDIMKSSLLPSPSLCKTNINWLLLLLHINVKFTVIGEYKI